LLFIFCGLMIILAAFGFVSASERNSSPSAHSYTDLSLLHEPGYALLIRHALAPGIGDPPGFRIDDCASQRNLSGQGREQARDLGQRLSAAGISSARVFSSQWCRCLETAELLGLGPVIPLPALNSFFQDRHPGEERTEDLRRFLKDLPHGPAVVMVTHQVNISALTGRFAASGKGILVHVDNTGRVRVVGTWP
jgi:8-oxo-(d)GTP phosphatase